MLQQVLAAVLALATRDAPPPYEQKATTARWMTKRLDWGVLATNSVRLNGHPFGNSVSFCDPGDGHLYFYVTSMDASMQDVASDPRVSFTLSEASLPGMCSPKKGSLPDPEDPTCARLTISGEMLKVNESSVPEVSKAMFARHPQMKDWPTDHGWFFATIAIADIWLIDYYGGASLVNVSEYYAVPSASPPPTVRPDLSMVPWRDGPPPGPHTKARCPVTGANLTITASTPSLAFKNGQKLFFSSGVAASLYKEAPRNYWLSPHELPLAGPDGMRGLPDLRGEIVHCPRSNETLNVSMQTPRVVQRHGQSVYFCCFGCVAAFWEDPKALFA